MAVRSIPSSAHERSFWGRCLRGYEGSFGTGDIADPTASRIGLSGQLNFTMPIDEWQLRDVWESTGIDTKSKSSGWLEIELYEHFLVNMSGVKLGLGLLKGECWLGGLSFYFCEEKFNVLREVKIGNIGGRGILELFDEFDRWLDGKAFVAGYEDVIARL